MKAERMSIQGVSGKSKRIDANKLFNEYENMQERSFGVGAASDYSLSKKLPIGGETSTTLPSIQMTTGVINEKNKIATGKPPFHLNTVDSL